MPARRIRSSSTTSSRPCTRAPGCTRSTRAGRRARSGPTAGSASTSAATSRWPTPSRARSSPSGLENREFIERATVDFDAYKAKVESYTLEYAERETGVPAEAIRELAHAFATAPRAMICWTLGITEHHNAVDNVLALISLVLLTGHVGRYGSGVNPLRGQNNVQGGGDMGALPDRLPGLPARRERRAPRQVRRRLGRDDPAAARLAPVGDVRRDGAGRPDRRVLHRREPGPIRSRPAPRDQRCWRGSTCWSCRTCS